MLYLLAALLTMENAFSLPTIFSDGMVLQRERPIPVFGKGLPGTDVSATLSTPDGAVLRSARTKISPEGRWQLRLAAMRAGGPFVLLVRGSVEKRFEDVLLGEVWVCSGQSNMEWPVELCSHRDEAVANPMPQVRMFTVQKASTASEASDVGGRWAAATSEHVLQMSGVGHAFAQALHTSLKVPIGMIHTSWGGTPAESWTTFETLETSEATRPISNQYKAALADLPRAQAQYRADFEAWRASAFPQESDNRGHGLGWAGFAFDDSDWPAARVGLPWETSIHMDFDGAMWWRVSFDLPADVAGKDATLSLGKIDDTDVTYFNGALIGATRADTPSFWEYPRSYSVPGGLVNAGRNVLAVRVFDNGGQGGLLGPVDRMFLQMASGVKIPLDANWRYMVEQALEPQTGQKPAPNLPLGPGNPWAPGTLMNGMVAPLIPYGIRGAIWYQGESNVGRAQQYETLFPMMITDWRRRWGQGNFPFYFVQLANFLERRSGPTESAWAELRESQRKTLRIPNTGMAVAIDIGEADDIHPRNKKDVGLRLARIALARDYGHRIVYSGPSYARHRVEGNRIRVRMQHAQGMRTVDGQAPLGFEVASADGRFSTAEARIEGDSIVLRSPGVARPSLVRYAWADNPAVNLVNSDGLPAVPFQTGLRRRSRG